MPTGRVPSTGQIIHTAGPAIRVDVSPVRYVNEIASDGWLQAKDEVTHGLVPLAKYTGVRVANGQGDRTTFKVIDGPQAGKTLSVTTGNANRYLGIRAPQRSPAEIEVTYGKYVAQWHSVARGQDLDQQMATLKIGAISVQVTMNTNWGGAFYPLPAGVYDVLVPDAPHNANMTHYYRNTYKELVYDQVWFPVKYNDNSRFVHIGNVSDGCVTVLDMNQWPAIHEAIISHRSRDGLSVARLTVKGKPERAK
jgi:hypothetical protein